MPTAPRRDALGRGVGLILAMGAVLAIGSCGDRQGEDATPEAAIDGYFTANHGQIAPAGVRLYHASGNARFGFERGSVLVELMDAPPAGTPPHGGVRAATDLEVAADRLLVDAVLYRMTFVGANPVVPEGRGRLPFPSHFFKGRDPAGWRTHVPSYREVIYRGIYDGIDLVYRASGDGLKYEFHVQPGADPSRIEIACEGVEGVAIGPGGEVVVRTAIGEVRDAPPVSFVRDAGAGEGAGRPRPEAGEIARPLESRYVIRGPASYGFEVDRWSGGEALVIDPLVYSSFVGGKRNDYPRSITVDDDGFAYLGGWTVSEDFPTTPRTYQKDYTGTQDAFVVKVDPEHPRPVYSTYVGGNDEDDCYSVRVDSRGRVHFSGQTRSTDFPVTDGSTHAGGRFDAIVVVLEDTGDELVYAGYIGGSDDDWGYSLDIDEDGIVTMGGFTRSADFPVTPGAFDETYGGKQDGYIVRVDTLAETTVFATYVGGSDVDFGWALAVDEEGAAYLTGSTISARDFPVTAGSFDETYNGTQDAYVLKLAPDGSSVVYSGFLGGLRFDRGFSIDVDGAGAAYVCGATRSADFPATPGAFDETYGDVDNGRRDGFVAKVHPSGGSIEYATYLGGSQADEAFSIEVNDEGEAHLTGITRDPDFPVTPGAYDETYNGEGDAFVTVLDAAGAALVDSTFLGAADFDQGLGVAVGPEPGEVWAAGETQSRDFPLEGKPFDRRKGKGVREGFVSRFL